MSEIDQSYQQKLLQRRYPLDITITGHQDSKPKEGDGGVAQGVGKGESTGPDAQKTEEQLRADPQFLQDAGSIYSAFTGKQWTADHAALADWGIEKLANFDLAIGDITDINGNEAGGGLAGQAAQILNNFSPEQAQSFLRALEAYDQLPNFTLPGFGRFVRNVAADPSSVLGVATLGAGLVGRQGARQAAKEGVKQALRQRIGSAILNNPLKVGAGEAATYVGTADALKQKVEVQAGANDSVDYGQTAIAAGTGAALGAGVMKAAPYVGKAVTKGMENLAAPRAPKVGPGAQVGAVGDLSQKRVIEIVSQAETEGWDAKKILETLKKLGVDPEVGAPVEVFKPTAQAMGKVQKELHAQFPNEYTDVADMAAPTQQSFGKGMYKDPEKIGPSFAARLDDDGKRYMQWVEANQNQTAIHANQKTGNSIDFSTSCANRSCGSGACAYCYVEHVRTQKANGLGAMMSPKKVVENDYLGEIMRMPPSLVKAYNMDGGLRMFSFGDFRPGIDDDNVARVLADAQKRGLFIKAITKEVELIKRFGDHPNLRLNVSIDNVPRDISHAITLDDAAKLKGQYPNLRIRTVALNAAEAEMYGKDPRVDVVTLYHGATNFKIDRETGSPTNGQRIRTDKLYEIVKAQNPKIVEKMGDAKFKAWLDTWEDNSPHTKFAKEFQQKYAGRVCCQSGKCAGDSTKCGFATKMAQAGAVALLILGGANSIFLGEADENEAWQ